MDHDAFVDTVMQAAGIDHEEAERAVRATLTTLAERISAWAGIFGSPNCNTILVITRDLR